MTTKKVRVNMNPRIGSSDEGYIEVLYTKNQDGSYSPNVIDQSTDTPQGLTDAELRATPVLVTENDDMFNPSVTPILTVHETYIAGDYVGESGVPMTFTNTARANGGSNIIRAKLLSKVLTIVSMELWLFDALITPPADSAAWSITDADFAHCVGVLTFDKWFASALNAISFSNDVMWTKCDPASRNLYGTLVNRGALTLADGDITAKLITAQR